MHFPSCCSLQPPSLLCPLPGLLGGFHPAHPQIKGWIQHWIQPGFPNLLWWSGSDTTLPHLRGWDPSSFVPNPFPVLQDGSNSTCFSHCLYLHFIYPLFCHMQVLTALKIHPGSALPQSGVPSPSCSILTRAKKFVIYPWSDDCHHTRGHFLLRGQLQEKVGMVNFTPGCSSPPKKGQGHRRGNIYSNSDGHPPAVPPFPWEF